MADITVTPGSVQPGANARTTEVTWGGTVTAGMSVRADTATGKWIAAQATSLAGAGSGGVGLAANGGADGQPGKVIRSGNNVVPGATLVVGARYYVSKNAAGGIMPEADLASNDHVTLLGIATSASVLKMQPLISGVQVP